MKDLLREQEKKLEAWSQQAGKQIQAARAANGELELEMQKLLQKAEEISSKDVGLSRSDLR